MYTLLSAASHLAVADLRPALPHLHLRRVIPISPWTILSGVVLVALSLLCWRRLAGALHWRPLPTLLALLGMSEALAMTLSPRSWLANHRSLQQCLPHSWGSFADSALRVGGSLESLLNIAMLMPLGFGLVLACRRVGWPALLVVTLPAAIELAQVVVPGRQCSPSDWVANSLGGLIAVALGALVNRRLRATATARTGPGPALTGQSRR